MTEWKRYYGMSAEDRMLLNNSYWEDQYERAKNMKFDDSSLLVKICPTCGWSGRTSLTFCFRRIVHTHPVKMNIVPKELVSEVQHE